MKINMIKWKDKMCIKFINLKENMKCLKINTSKNKNIIFWILKENQNLLCRKELVIGHNKRKITNKNYLN